MIPAALSYARATDIADALRRLEDAGGNGKLLAGGQSLIPMMKLRLLTPSRIIDLGGIAALREFAVIGDRVRLGALAIHARVAGSAELAAAAPVLTDAAGSIGDPQIRNFGTIGGSAAHNDPAADYPAVLLAVAATFTLTSATGSRDVPADAFFIGMYETSLDGEREILTEISFERSPFSAYVKLEHPATGYAIAGAAVCLTLGDGIIAGARVAISGVGDVAYRAAAVEAALADLRVDDDRAIAAACRGAADGVDARGDVHAPSDYRVAMADVVIGRAVQRALHRADV